MNPAIPLCGMRLFTFSQLQNDVFATRPRRRRAWERRHPFILRRCPRLLYGPPAGIKDGPFRGRSGRAKKLVKRFPARWA